MIYPMQVYNWYWGAWGAWCIFSLLMFVVWIFLAIWVYKDAKKRDENAILWLLIVFFLGIIGLIIWLVIRPDMAEVHQKRQQQQYYGGQYGQQPYQQQQYGQQQYQQPQHPPQQHQPPPQQPPQQQAATNPCPGCGQQMRWVQQYNRWYCDNCREYK